MELFRALGAFAEPPGPHLAPIVEALQLPGVPAAASHAELFELELPPFASIYLGAEGRIGGEARDRIAGFLRVLGVAPPVETDHLATLLATYAVLGERASDDDDPASPAQRARTVFLVEHLASWLLPFLRRVPDLAGGAYGPWAALLEQAVEAELADSAEPKVLPPALFEAAPLSDPRTDGPGAFLDGLLAPVRSGLVLTRGDLASAARELDVGCRPVARRSVLETLLGAEPQGSLYWLARRARTASASYRAGTTTRLFCQFWAARAETTAELCRALCRTAPTPERP